MHFKTLAPLLAFSLALSGSAFADSPAKHRRAPTQLSAPSGARAIVARTPQPASPSDVQRYAQREGASPGAQNYEGGDAVIVIGASAATIILAVVLLVVLL